MTKAPSSDCPRRIWALPCFLIMPLALIHQPLADLPGPGVGQPVFWYCAVLLAAGVYACRGRPPVRLVPWPLAVLIVLALAGQGLAMHESAAFWGSPWSELLRAYGQLLLGGGVLLICALCLRLLAALPGGAAGLWAGWIAACLALLGLCLLQLAHLALSRWAAPPALAELRAATEAALRWISAFPGLGTGWQDGAVDGVFASGRELVLALSLTTLPLLLGLRRVSGPWQRRLWDLMLMLLLAVLVATRSAAALPAVVLAGIWLIAGRLADLPLTRGQKAGLGLGCLLACCALGVLLALDADSRQFALRALDGGWNMARRSVLEELWNVFRERPWYGSGWGWSEAFVLHSDSLLARLGLDAVRPWLEGAPLPEPSFLVRVLAEWGGPLPALALAGLVWLGVRLRRRAGGEGAHRGLRLASAVLPVWLSALLLFCLGNLEPDPLLFWLPAGLCWAASGAASVSSGAAPRDAGEETVTVLREALISDSPSRPFSPGARP